jgi:hypothetical protein
MARIRFETTPLQIGDWTVIRLPEKASAKLPSRGMTLVEGTINGFSSKIVLEPDGKGSHWFKVDSRMRKSANIIMGRAVAIEMEPSKEWDDPEVPLDLRKALVADSQAYGLWKEITPMARWDWLRWIRSTNNPQTRQRRITVALSKLKADSRRPCCFNRNQCTEPEVSKNGVLMEPTLTPQSRGSVDVSEKRKR